MKIDAAGDDTLAALATGDLDVVGRLTDASNVALLVRVGGRYAIYKPIAGERPLWDFPHGSLANREVAAHLVSAAGGWDLVPATVLRDGPLGIGSVQDWIGPAPDAAGHLDPAGRDPGLVGIVPVNAIPESWRAVLEGELGSGAPVFVAHADDYRLRSLAVLDAVLNNCDRKGSHILAGDGERIWGIDNGLCLAREPKLRTVLWGWAGEPIPESETRRCESLRHALGGELGEVLAELVTANELAALGARLQAILASGVHPTPSHGWPPLPWPPV